jgi:hypothetical protein
MSTVSNKTPDYFFQNENKMTALFMIEYYLARQDEGRLRSVFDVMSRLANQDEQNEKI